MPRTKVRKTDRGTKDVSIYEYQAYEDLNKQNLSIRAAAMRYKLCHVSLTRYKKKREEASKDGKNSLVRIGYRAWNKVFSDDQEKMIVSYIIRAANIYFGFPPKEIKKFGYELANKYKLSYPSQWEENKMASKDWFTNFMKRQPQLSIRCAQPTSMSRATSFNETNVNMEEHRADGKSEEFTPEAVRPFPKAPPRKEGNRGKKKRKSIVYTDTPEKEKIRTEHDEKHKKKVKKNISDPKRKTKNSYKKNKLKNKDRKEDSDKENKEYYCLVCLESYSTSKPGEKWVQCIACKSWSHEQCTQQNDSYICHNCDSK